MSTQDGGPAFPVQELNHDGSPYSLQTGMSLRDYFAAHASEFDIKRHMPTGRIVPKISVSGGTKHFYDEAEMRTAEQARYHYADAMLEARKA